MIASVKKKTTWIEREVAEMSRRLGPGGKLPTVREMCKTFGVAWNTLSRVLEDLERRRLIDRRHGSGLYVSGNIGSKSIGVVFGSEIFEAGNSPVYGLLLKHCCQRVQSHQQSIRFYIDLPQVHAAENGQLRHADLAHDMETGQVRALIFTCHQAKGLVESRQRLGIPAVSFLPGSRGKGIVGVDYAALVSLGVAALARRGCRRLALLSVLKPSQRQAYREHLSAFRQSLTDNGLAAEQSWFTDDVPESFAITESSGRVWREQGRRAVAELFHGWTPKTGSNFPDGLVIVDDMMASGALDELTARGLRVGTDLQVASHSNAGSTTLLTYEQRVYRLEFAMRDVVEAIFALLEPQLNGGSPPRTGIVVGPACLEPKPEVRAVASSQQVT